MRHARACKTAKLVRATKAENVELKRELQLQQVELMNSTRRLQQSPHRQLVLAQELCMHKHVEGTARAYRSYSD